MAAASVPAVFPTFGTWFLYEYGSFRSDGSGLTTSGEATVAAFVTIVCSIPIVAVLPPDPFTTLTGVSVSWAVVTPIAYYTLFSLLDFGIGR